MGLTRYDGLRMSRAEGGRRFNKSQICVRSRSTKATVEQMAQRMAH
jgi:hypothetical protein